MNTAAPAMRRPSRAAPSLPAILTRWIEPGPPGERLQAFLAAFALEPATRIIDLGGRAESWTELPAPPRVTVVNMRAPARATPGIAHVVADACALSAPDGCCDVVFSSSVIEHVGGWDRQRAFAREVRRLAPRYFVRTPYRFQPIEPHFVAFGIHMLPRALFRRALGWGSLWGWRTRPSTEAAAAAVDALRLLSVREMQLLFPEARIVRERGWLFTRALLAIRA